MEFRAQTRFVRVSPQKARLVLDLIKGQRVEDALNTLAFTKKRIAAKIEKLVRSAVENANYLSTEKNVDVDLDNLYVKHAVANDGPRISLCAAHCAYRNCAGGARQKRFRRSGDGCGRRASCHPGTGEKEARR